MNKTADVIETELRAEASRLSEEIDRLEGERQALLEVAEAMHDRLADVYVVSLAAA